MSRTGLKEITALTMLSVALDSSKACAWCKYRIIISLFEPQQAAEFQLASPDNMHAWNFFSCCMSI